MEDASSLSSTWISWFCSLPGHEYFCEVKQNFIEEDFNLQGLDVMIPFWKEAKEIVLDTIDDNPSKIPYPKPVYSSAELLYGLMHQRYILTLEGLQEMLKKYDEGIFGSCPRFYCANYNVVPCGQWDLPGLASVKLFCPNCNDIYEAPHSRFRWVDGSFFGTTFPHFFFQTYHERAPTSPRTRCSSEENSLSGGWKSPASSVYVPRVFGFKVSDRATSGPRMHWLRLRPESPSELDRVDCHGKWIGEDDESYVDEEDETEDDCQMEDFDSVG